MIYITCPDRYVYYCHKTIKSALVSHWVKCSLLQKLHSLITVVIFPFSGGNVLRLNGSCCFIDRTLCQGILNGVFLIRRVKGLR